MSRSANRDNLTAVTLFPFLAVLLCTMGSLVLILVVVAKVSRDKAVERAEAEQAARAEQALVEVDEDAVRQMKLAKARLSQLDRVKLAAEKTLRGDQLRLQHVEDHMGRLQKQLEALQLAAAELDEAEQEHFDDRKQATREVERLQQLIDDTQEQIAELEAEQGDGPRSYSIIPYKGPHGTARQPIYIECRKNEVVLQPEGIRLKPQDFQPPLGAGNPLASALRAAREFMVTRHPELGESADTEPYPLILVRPDGIGAYYRVRAAIESWDSDFGYELIGEDWNLEFPASNPELATAEARAIELARRRQRMLMAAAPNAYGRGSGALAGDSFHMEPSEGEGDFEDGGMGLGGAGDLAAGDTAEAISAERFVGMGQSTPGILEAPDAENVNGKVGEGTGENRSSSSDDTGEQYASESGGPQLYPATERGQDSRPSSTQQQTRPEANDNFVSLGTIPNRQPAQDKLAGEPGNERGRASDHGDGGAMASAGGTAGGSPSPSGGGQESSGSSATASLSFSNSSRNGGSGGSQPFTGSSPNDVPIRRAVQLVVRHDRVAILPDRTGNPITGGTLTGGKVILLEGNSSLAVDRVVSGLQEHVRNWGIAGSGLYWRPVLMLNIGPDGEARAEELTSLLRESGIELRNSATATRSEPGNANTTR